MSCPTFSETHLRVMKRCILDTNRGNQEIGMRFERVKKPFLAKTCYGDHCSVNIKPSQKQVGTWHSHPARKKSTYFAPARMTAT